MCDQYQYLDQLEENGHDPTGRCLNLCKNVAFRQPSFVQIYFYVLASS